MFILQILKDFLVAVIWNNKSHFAGIRIKTLSKIHRGFSEFEWWQPICCQICEQNEMKPIAFKLQIDPVWLETAHGANLSLIFFPNIS